MAKLGAEANDGCSKERDSRLACSSEAGAGSRALDCELKPCFTNVTSEVSMHSVPSLTYCALSRAWSEHT